jgi:hypothetical protein
MRSHESCDILTITHKINLTSSHVQINTPVMAGACMRMDDTDGTRSPGEKDVICDKRLLNSKLTEFKRTAKMVSALVEILGP